MDIVEIYEDKMEGIFKKGAFGLFLIMQFQKKFRRLENYL